MKKEWFFDCYCGRQFAALLEDGKLTEFLSEKDNDGEIVGNIYKGKVMNVLTGMNAAFVSCGLDKNCYLSMEESYTDYSKYDGVMGKMNLRLSELKVGDEILVQVTKPPRGNKGAKVTTHLSFVGKNLIYLPNSEFIGISRKITDEKVCERVLSEVTKLRDEKAGEGFIIRTQAPTAGRRKLKRESEFLKKIWRDLLERAKSAPVGKVLHKDLDLPLRVVRDSLGDELVGIHVGNKALYDRLLPIIRLQKDIPERKLELYQGERSMFREYGISQIIYDAVRPTVPLESGGYIVIDQTEAMTVVDVNTGSYVGDSNHEDTVFRVNVEAAREIARQVRLRNLGGLVIVDFIDMTEESHREKVTEVLGEYLALDKAKCNLLPMSEFCLSQFTRKRLGSDMASYLVKPCSHCKGNGHVHDDFFVITRIRADLLDLFTNGFQAAIVELNENIMHKILKEGMFTSEVKGRWKNKRIYFVPHRTYNEEYFSVRGDNSEILSLPDNAKILY